MIAIEFSICQDLANAAGRDLNENCVSSVFDNDYIWY